MAADHAAAPPAGPGFRVWPPVAIGVSWLAGWTLDQVVGPAWDPGRPFVVAGWVLIAAFAVWNGWCLILFARYRTGLLPGQETSSLVRSGPFAVCRNPLYLGLLALYVGVALVAGRSAPSCWRRWPGPRCTGARCFPRSATSPSGWASRTAHTVAKSVAGDARRPTPTRRRPGPRPVRPNRQAGQASESRHARCSAA